MDENGGSEQIRPIESRWPNEPAGRVGSAEQTQPTQSPQLIRPVHLFQPSSLASVQPAQRPPLTPPQPEQSFQPVDPAQSDQPTQPAQLPQPTQPVQPAEVATPTEPAEESGQVTGPTAETGRAKQPSQPAVPGRQSQSGSGWVRTDSKPIRPARRQRGGLLLLMIIVGAMLILVPVAMMISTVVGKIATYNKQVQTVRQF